MEPQEALERIADLLQRVRNQRSKVQAFRRAAEVIRDISPDELRSLSDAGRLTDLPGIGSSSAAVITEALAGNTPAYLENLSVDLEPPTDLAAPVRAALRGDLHLHSDWSDGGASIEAMARTAAELGHEYLALTDHSPLVRVANGLDARRLEHQLETLATANEELAPFRVLAGMEVDIRDDGSLDMDDALLARLVDDAQKPTRRVEPLRTRVHLDRLVEVRGGGEDQLGVEARLGPSFADDEASGAVSEDVDIGVRERGDHARGHRRGFHLELGVHARDHHVEAGEERVVHVE